MVVLGKHRDVLLKLPDGKRIRIDASWTSHSKATRPADLTHRVDFARIQPLVELLEYLNNKLNKDSDGHKAITPQ